MQDTNTTLTELTPGVRLIRRNRQIVPWSAGKIEKAVRCAFTELGLDSSPAIHVAAAVTARVKEEGNACVGIEDVQDMVQEELMKQGHYSVATHYILYRAERARLRLEMVDGETSPLPSEITIVGVDGNEPYNPVELHRRIAFARTGLDLCLPPKEIERELLRSVGTVMTRKDLKNTIILNAKTLIEKDADFGKFAGRILLTFIYEEVLDWSILRDGFGKLKKAHRAGFANYLARGVAIGRIDPALLERYDIEAMAKALDPSADLDFDYLGIQTLYDRYLLVDKTDGEHVRLETPQFFWMRVAMGLFKEESNRTTDPQDASGKVPADAEAYAISLYNLYKSRRFCSSTPTLFNSGTPHSQLSSCYISVVDDNIESIFQRGIADSAYMAKFAGGLGGSWTNVRGTGSHIKGTNGESQGVIPFFKVYNDMLNAVNQGGRRRGSGCNYLETWHNDLEDFMELRKNVGDDRRRCHEMNTAHWIPDLFMKRMEARQDWSYFRSNEVPDLHDLYGKAFEQRYAEYEALAAEGKIWTKVVPAVEVWKLMLKSVFETGHPWLTFKDPCNVRSPQDHCGVVHSSNLCCMTADQRVVTDKGILTVGELYKLEEPSRVAGRGAISNAGTMLLPRPGAPIVKIVTEEGYEHKVTPDHRVWVSGFGWTEARDLKVGDELELQHVSLFGKESDPELAFIAGLVAGDGSFMKGADSNVLRLDLVEEKTIHLKDRVLVATWKVIAESGVKVGTNGNLKPDWRPTTHGVRLNTSALGKALIARGISGETRTKVPDFVWRGDRETVINYIFGLFMTDGGTSGNAGRVYVALHSCNEEHLKEVQILLANFGIKCSVWSARRAGDMEFGNGTYGCNEVYNLRITSRDGVALFEETFGFVSERARYRTGALQVLDTIKVLGSERSRQKMTATFKELADLPSEDAYCLTVDSEDHAWTVNGLITHNTEITLNTSADEISVCNLGSVVIEEHLTDTGEIDHTKLKETVTLAVRALDNVIDINFYPVPATRTSNSRHRPIGLGMMGLQNALHKKGLAFASQEAIEFSDEIAEAIAYYAYSASSELAKEKGTYSTYKGSKWDRGFLPHDTIDLLQDERGIPIDTPRGGKLDWVPVRRLIAEHGMRNSNVMAIAPTATISNIMATTPCIEPNYNNLFVKSNMSGDFTVLSVTLVRELKVLGLWGQEMLDQLKYYDGELQDIPNIPEDVKRRHATVFGVPYEFVIDAAARRQKWIDQSQSVNLFLPEPDMKVLSRMYRYAWSCGLKTTYYLRTLGASGIEKSTIDAGKALRGLVGDQAAADAKMQCSIDNPESCEMCQ